MWAAVQLLCMGALMHGLGAYEPMCTPLATPLLESSDRAGGSEWEGVLELG